MSFNLLDSVKGLFTNDLISNAASSLGESEGGIQKALSGALPSILTGIIGKAGSYTGAAGILDQAKQTAGTGILNNLNGFFGNDNSSLLSRGAEMLKAVLGDRAGGVASLVSNFAGVKHSSASIILSMVAPAVLGVLGRHANESKLDTGGLMSFLSGQKASILNALPSALSSVGSLVGAGSIDHAMSSAHNEEAESVHHATHYAKEDTSTTTGGLKFMVPVLLAVFLVALGIYLFNGCGSQSKDEIATTDSTAAKISVNADSASTTLVTTARELFKVKLPNDTIIDAFKGGIEDKLVAFLSTDYKKLGEDSLKKIWFDFDNLNFETGSAKITTESQAQVNNIAAILKAFPAATLKIGGYTDKVGDEAVNKKLSDARAKSVQAALNKAGVGKQITKAEGYGAAFAVYGADAPESDRIKDRHVSVSVR